jgi:hypothetical protein
MDDDRPHTEQGQIERARRLRQTIEDLHSHTDNESSSEGKSLKEQIEERARAATEHESGKDSG